MSALEAEIDSLRSLITDVRPAALDDMGTAAALGALADRARSRGLGVDLNVDLDYEQGRRSDRHTIELETTMYRLVQEALTYATKHGDAKHASIEIHEDEAAVRVTIKDDGRGFDTTAPTGGFGLIGMHERAELLDGDLEIESAPGHGTTVRASLPAQRRSQVQPS